MDLSSLDTDRPTYLQQLRYQQQQLRWPLTPCIDSYDTSINPLLHLSNISNLSVWNRAVFPLFAAVGEQHHMYSERQTISPQIDITHLILETFRTIYCLSVAVSVACHIAVFEIRQQSPNCYGFIAKVRLG